MSICADIKARLLDQGVFSTVLGAAQLAAVADRRQFANGTAYVLLSSAKPAGNLLINAVEQRLTESYSIVFWVAVAGDATGDAVVDQVETLREQVQAALLGWSPDGVRSPMLYAGGQLSHFESGAVLWEESFSTESYLRNPNVLA